MLKPPRNEYSGGFGVGIAGSDRNSFGAPNLASLEHPVPATLRSWCCAAAAKNPEALPGTTLH